MAGVPIAVSRLGDGDSREAQNARAVKWLLVQPGGIAGRRDAKTQGGQPEHRTTDRSAWGAAPRLARILRRELRRQSCVLYAWPDRERLNEVWNVDADAIAVIEWGVEETAEWLEDVNPVQLLPGQIIESSPRQRVALEPLPNGVDAILEHIAAMAAGYSSGLKWNEKDQLKADMMNRPDRWAPITVDQIRAKCRQLGMRADNVDTITDPLQRRKDGRRFNVRSSYRTFQFS